MMGCLHASSRAVLCIVCALAASSSAEEPDALPDPLRLEHVIERASQRRFEVAAALARARAAAQRPAVVSALDDPMVVPSVDHLPFSLQGADVSLWFEQRFPLSRIRSHRRSAAEANAARLTFDSKRVELDVELEAAAAFYKLQERRGIAEILAEQRTLAQQMVRSATARYSAGTGGQADVCERRSRPRDSTRSPAQRLPTSRAPRRC